jgi:hypothetical protein
MQSIASTHSYSNSSWCNLYDDVTCTTIAVPPSVLRLDWKTLAWLASTRSNPSYLDACPVPFSLYQFCGATDKPSSTWFWDSNQETVAVILRPKSPNRSCPFWDPNWKTWATGFEVKPGETILVVLRLNHWQTVDLGFKAQPKNSRSSSPCAWYRLHTASPDLPIVWPPSTRPVLDHAQSSVTGLLLLSRSLSLPTMLHLPPAHHEISKHDSPHK